LGRVGKLETFRIKAAGAVFACLSVATLGRAQTVNIVGLGAVTCEQFNSEVRQNFNIQRDYFAWAQGFMSGLLMRASSETERNIDLNPTAFPLLKQVEFLREFCEQNSQKDYSDGVADLYRALRESKK